MLIMTFVNNTFGQTSSYSNNNSAKATVNKVWVNKDVRQNGQLGIMIHADVSIKNMKGRNTDVVAYFFDIKKQQMRAVLNNYKTNDFHACNSKNVVPNYVETQYTDLKIFMPYDALPSISGYVRVEVSDRAAKKFLSNDKKYTPFNISQNNSGNNGNRNSGSNKSNNNNQNNNNQNNDPQIKVPVTVYCAFCAGSKICPDCAGQRTRYFGRDKIICTSCSGTGICDMCHGTGISMVVYQ